MIRRRLFTTLAAGSALALAACSFNEEPTSRPSNLDAAAFKDRLTEDVTVIVDVRSPEEFEAGHIEGAVNINVESPTFAADIEQLDKDAPHAVYCRSGNRSQVALDTMKAAGFDNAYHLTGGIGAWQAAGYPVVD